MGKLIKYDIKGNYKYYSGLYIIMVVISIIIVTLSKIYNNSVMVAPIALGVLILIIIQFTPFIKETNYFYNELTEDTGYLLFSVPRESYEILGAKILSGLIWIVLTSVIVSVLGMIDFYVLVPYSTRILISSAISNSIGWNALYFQFIASSLFGIISAAFIILIIYFSIILSKVVIKSKKLGGFISFVVFILISIIYAYITVKLSNLFPQSIKLPLINSNQQMFSQIYSSTNLEQITQINIAVVIENILLFIGFFIGSSKLMERIDL